MEKVTKKTEAVKNEEEITSSEIKKLKEIISDGMPSKESEGFKFDEKSMLKFKFLMSSNEKLLKENSNLRAKTEMFKLVNNSFVNQDGVIEGSNLLSDVKDNIKNKFFELKSNTEEDAKELKKIKKEKIILVKKLKASLESLESANTKVEQLLKEKNELSLCKIDVEKELKVLKNERFELERDFNEKSKTKLKSVQDVMVKLNDLTSKHQEIKKQLEDKDQEISDLTLELKKAKNLNEIQKREYDASEYKKSIQVRENNKNLRSIQKENKDLLTEKEENSKLIKTLNERVFEKEKEIKSLSNNEKNLLNEIELGKKALKSTVDEHSNFNLKHEEVIAGKNEIIKKLEEKSALFSEEKKNLEDRISKLESEISKKDDLKLEFENKNNNLAESNNFMAEEILGLKSKISKADEVVKNYSDKIVALNDKIEKMAKDFESDSAMKASAISDKTSTNLKLRSEIKSKIEKIESLENERNSIKALVNSSDEELQSLKSKFESKIEEFESYRKEQEDTSLKLSSELKNLSIENAKLKSENKNFETKLLSDSEKYENERLEFADLNDELVGLKSRLEDVNAVNDKLKQDNFTLKEDLIAREKKTSGLIESLNSLQIENNEIKIQTSQTISDLKIDLDKITSRHEKMIKDYDESETVFLVEAKELNAKHDKLSADYSGLQGKFSDLSEKYKFLKEENESINKELITATETIKSYEGQVSQKLKVIEDHEKSLKELRADLHRKEQDNNNAITRHNTLVKSKDESFANLELELELSRRELQQLQERFEALQTENEESVDKNELLLIDVEKMNNKLRLQEQSNLSELQALKNELKTKSDEIEDFSDLRVEVNELKLFLNSKEESLKVKEEDVYQREAKAKFFQKWFEQQKKIFRKKIIEFAHEIRISYNLSPLNDYLVVLDTEIQRTKKSMEYAGVGQKYSILEKQLNNLSEQKSNIEELINKSKLEFNHRSKEFVNMLNDSDLLPTPPVPPKSGV